MRYKGGKVKQARAICDVIKPECYSLAWDAFVGGGSITAEMCRRVAAVNSETRIISSDVNDDLIAMWLAVSSGWSPPGLGRNITDEEYAAYRAMDSSPIRTFVGFSCAWGGNWGSGLAKSKRNEVYYEEGRRLLLKKAEFLNHAEFSVMDFLLAEFPPPGSLVYCDPPYRGTSGYKCAKKFDHDAFWAKCKELAEHGCDVYVSEFSAPDYCDVVWQRPRKSSLTRNDRAVLPESLFKVRQCPPSKSYAHPSPSRPAA